MRKSRVGIATLGVALIGVGAWAATPSFGAAAEKPSTGVVASSQLSEKADELIKSRNISEPLAKGAGTGHFGTRYVPTGYKIIDEYDIVLNGYDENNVPVKSSDALTAHVIELATKSRTDLSVQGEAASIVTVVSVADKKAKTGQLPDTRGQRRETRVHGRPAVVTQLEGSANSSFVKWTERDGLALQVNGANVSGDEVLAIAKGLEEK